MIDKKESSNTKRFGVQFGIIIAVIFGLLLPWIRHRDITIYPWIVSVVFIGLSFLVPQVINLFYKGWMAFASALGWLNTRLMLSVIFYLIITPMGLISKLIKRNPMKLKFDKCANTYRINSIASKPERMEVPY